MVETKLVPPDGGYGWIIMGACALYFFITIPIAQGFGLVFKDKFTDLGFSAANISLIMNTNAAFSMFVGIMVAPLLKHLGYRKVALIAGGLLTVGVLLTAYANSFTQYVITYGFIAALGAGMGMPAYSLAQNSFFIKNRTRSMGYTLTFCGFGPVIMPQIFSFLIESYGTKGAVIIIAGITANTFVSGFLLQPVKWHMKKEIVEDIQDADIDNLLTEEEKKNESNARHKKLAQSTLSLEEAVQIEATYNIDTPLSGSVLSLHQGIGNRERSHSVSSRKKVKAHQKSIQEDIEMDEFQLTPQKEENMKVDSINTHNVNNENGVSSNQDSKTLIQERKENENRPLLKRIGKHLVDIFDLTLLRDKIFLNIMIGMSFAVFAEINFSVLTPFIMRDFGLATQQIATFMSTVSIADICFRFVAPYVSDFFAKPVRIMYMWSLVLLILARYSLLLTNNYYGLLTCALFLGIAKGFRTVYWTLVIPNSVPIDRLAAASGLQSTFNSFLIWTGGPFLGFVRDATGSYRNCIFVINSVTFVTIVLWSTEFAYKRFKSRRKLDNKHKF